MEKNRIRPIKTGKSFRMSYSRQEEVLEMPNLIEVQKDSYKWFLDEGLKEVFDDISPIADYSGHLSLEFVDFTLCEDDVKYTIDECKERDATYAAPLKVRVRLYNKENDEINEHEIFMGDLPLMTKTGTFVINGAERVIVSQLVRSPGIYYGIAHDKFGKKLYSATVIPNRGAWLEYETDSNDVFYVRVDRTRKVPITVLIRALGIGTNAEIIDLFGEEPKILASFTKDTSESYQEGLLELYKKIRPGEPLAVDSAESLITSMFFDPRRYDLAKVGRYKFNKKLNLKNRVTGQVLAEDVVSAVTGEVVAEKGTKITRELAGMIQNSAAPYIWEEGEDESRNIKVLSNLMVDLQSVVDIDPAEVGVTTYAYNTSRSVPAYDENGELWFYQKNNVSYDQPFSIINERKNSYDKINTEQLGLNVSLEYRLLQSLKVGVFCSYNVSNSSEDVYFADNTWYIADLKKASMSTGEIDITTTLCPVGGELRMDNTKNENYSLRGTLTFNKAMDKELNHVLSASLIGELSSSKYTGFKITKRGYMPDRGMIFNKLETMNKDNLYTAYNEWLLTDDAMGVMKDNLTNLVGLVGSFVYSYKNSYIFNVNGRIDFSNKFGDASNDKLLPIWSVSGRWNMHENVLKNVGWIDMLALKMSFGYQGNMSALDSPRLIIKKEGMDNSFKELYSTIANYPNPNLKWEKTSTYNIDVDFSLLNRKIRGTIGYYYRYTRDAFLSKKVSVVNGVEAYTVNEGNLRNQGYELTLNFMPVNTATSLNGQQRGIVWRFDPNFGSVFNQLIDKVKRKDRVLQDEVKYEDYLNGKVQVAGRPVNTFYSYRFKGLNPENGSPMFYGTDKTTMVNGEEKLTKEIYGEMDREDVWLTVMEHSGAREPFLQGSISNYLGWRNLGLSFNLAYSVGSKIRLFRMFPNDGVVVGPEKNLRREFVNRWRQPGDEKYTNVPGILTGSAWNDARWPWWTTEPYKFSNNLWEMYDFSNIRVVSGNYLKLSSLSLRYVVPEYICKKMRVKSLYVNLSGTNLFTICSRKLKGQDPSQSGSTSLINLSVRPTYSLQLNVTF